MHVILIKQKLGGTGKKYPVKYLKSNLEAYGMPKANGWRYRLATEEEGLEFAAQLGIKLTKKKEAKKEQEEEK
jgi:hypothetical protein